MDTQIIGLTLVTVDEDHCPDRMLKYACDRYDWQLSLELLCPDDGVEQTYAIVSPAQHRLILRSFSHSNLIASSFLKTMAAAVDKLTDDKQSRVAWNRGLSKDQTQIRRVIPQTKRILCTKSDCTDIDMAVHEHLMDWVYERNGEGFWCTIGKGHTSFSFNQLDWLQLDCEMSLPTCFGI